MRQVPFLFAITLLYFSCSSGKTEQSASTASLDSYEWLIGKWEMTPDPAGGVVTEEWTVVNDSTYAGKSSATDSTGTIVFSETMELKMRNGRTYYIPTVPDQNAGKPVEFLVSGNDSAGFTAENKTHDFPQRIIYRQTGPKEMIASIEGTQSGKMRKEEFRMKKQ